MKTYLGPKRCQCPFGPMVRATLVVWSLWQCYPAVWWPWELSCWMLRRWWCDGSSASWWWVISWRDDAAQVSFLVASVGVEAEGSGRMMRVCQNCNSTNTWFLLEGRWFPLEWKHSCDLDRRLTLIVLILVVLTDHWLDHRLIVLNPQAQSMIPICCHEIHKHYFMYAKMVLVWQLAVKQPTLLVC
jgi:hypothetical protein